MKTDAVAAAVSEALRLVNRSRAEWPEDAVEHAARRAYDLARDEVVPHLERFLRSFPHHGYDNVRTCGLNESDDPKELCVACWCQETLAAIRAGSGE